jgi:DNA-binding CsgD family transcriptional regulator
MNLSFYKSWADHATKYLETNYKFKNRFELFNNDQFKELFNNTSAIILIVSHLENKYEFISDNVKDILGFTSDDFYKGNAPFGMSLVHPDHAKIFMEFIFPKMFSAIEENKSAEDLKNLRMTYNFKMRRKDNSYIWVQQIMSILESDIEGRPVLTMYVMQDVSAFKKDDQLDFVVSTLGDDGFYKQSMIINYPSKISLELSGREIQIISLISQGKSSKDIANELNISCYTVQTHRRNMLRKTKSKNTAELLKLAMVKGIAS